MSTDSKSSKKKSTTEDRRKPFKQKKWRDSGIREMHGKTNTRIHIVWNAMHSRCTNRNQQNYDRYGGKGIRVCERWNSFTSFLEDMGDPGIGWSIDRIDSRGPYSKANCRWVRPEQQSRNKSDNRMIGHNGATRCLAEWAEISAIKGLTGLTIHKRLQRGWTFEDAISVPLLQPGYRRRIKA